MNLTQKQAVKFGASCNPSSEVRIADHDDHGKALRITDPDGTVRWCDIATGVEFDRTTP